MFHLNGSRFVLLLLLVVFGSLGIFLYLDSLHPRWTRDVYKFQDLVRERPADDEQTTYKPMVNKTKEFVPTHEWQTIEKDQAIPAGLHVKLNLETGEKQAKLIDDNKNDQSTSANNLAIVAQNETEKATTGVPKASSRFRSYDEIKKDLKDINLTVKTDMEIMNGLSMKFKEHMETFNTNENQLVNILTDLEYLVHQVDTAEVFIKENGLKTIILPCINSSANSLKAHGAQLLGSAASNNPKVQIAALEAQAIPILLKHIEDDNEFLVRANCLYALSNIIRRFPLAQEEFIKSKGLPMLMSLFQRTNTQNNMKLRLKVVRLLEDLVIEREDAELTLQEETNEKLSSLAKERVRQYKHLDLKAKLVSNKWCQTLGNVFIQTSDDPDTEESHEFVEAAGKSLLAMEKSCKLELQGNKEFSASLNKLYIFYKKLYSKDTFFKPLYTIINQLTNIYDPVTE
ncbi:nucleotide exchange factor SIL1 isoform X2 [Adelges cooleyi]|uniref:nucleotide exchange factor SIL1 isoform X2 n=1 Tax=Adelges cooleyi TaxID=133065 RepID=UPI002180940A|nr:nucleotide exchange factor SIL1 isoform X2 [Adelges cooleyi]